MSTRLVMRQKRESNVSPTTLSVHPGAVKDVRTVVLTKDNAPGSDRISHEANLIRESRRNTAKLSRHETRLPVSQPCSWNLNFNFSLRRAMGRHILRPNRYVKMEAETRAPCSNSYRNQKRSVIARRTRNHRRRQAYLNARAPPSSYSPLDGMF